MSRLEHLVVQDHAFRALQDRKRHLIGVLSLTMVVAYFSFILIVAFAPEQLAIPLGDNTVVTRGIVLAFGLLLLAPILAGMYMWCANDTFDPMLAAIITRIEIESHGTEQP